jgi:hypothetical protein
MEYIETTYEEDELAWVSPVITIHRDIYLMVTLKKKGKLVIRQDAGDGEMVRVPIKQHKDTVQFFLRMQVNPDTVKLQIFTSTEPKEIKYAYI